MNENEAALRDEESEDRLPLCQFVPFFSFFSFFLVFFFLGGCLCTFRFPMLKCGLRTAIAIAFPIFRDLA